MKKTLLILTLFLFCNLGNSQTDTFQKIKDLLQQYHPELNTENKLIAFTMWSSEDKESREILKRFDKVYTYYEFAKLKGGSKGLIVVAFNQTNSESTTQICFHKDGVLKTIAFNANLFEATGLDLKNAVFDSNGKMIFKNLTKDLVVESIHQRVTR